MAVTRASIEQQGLVQHVAARSMAEQVKKKKKQVLVPVVLIPGAGGSQLLAKLTHAYNPSFWLCRPSSLALSCFFKPEDEETTEQGFFRLWLNVPGILPPFTSCFAERIRLFYNPLTGICENAPGVETRVPGFGSTSSMAYLDPSFRPCSVVESALATTFNTNFTHRFMHQA